MQPDPHCHFEVAVPVDTNILLYNEGGGWINEAWADNLVPLFCNVPGNIMEAGETYTALSCGAGCDAIIPVLDQTYSAGQFVAMVDDDALSNTLNMTFEGASAGVIQSGSSVTLKPGFYAEFLSTFEARIGECSGAGFNKTMLSADGKIEDAFLIEPNPASQTTMFKWEMQETGEVKISILDIRGHELIKVLQPQLMSAGWHQQKVNLSGIASGAYILDAIINGEHVIKKIIVQHD